MSVSKITSTEFKKKFLDYFGSKGHIRIPNSSLIPENDPSALFINSGMHPLIPYLLGEPHPYGESKRLMNTQRAVRTVDIDKIGESLRHLTFMQMLGEWSLGDYWKQDSLEFSVEFLVEILGFDINRLYGTVYEGDEVVPCDNEAIEIWKGIYKKYGIEASVGTEFTLENCPRIITLGKDDNFWTVGGYGPCGSTSEIYYDRGYGDDPDIRYLEVVNNVFMEYNLSNDGKLTPLKQKNIDVGWGLERLMSIIWNLDAKGNLPLTASVFDTSDFDTERDFLLEKIGKNFDEYLTNYKFRKPIRLILDHIRSSVMIIADGIEPSNKDQGYVLRRLIRTAVTFGRRLDFDLDMYLELASMFINKLASDEEYSFIKLKHKKIQSELKNEIEKFNKVLNSGIKEVGKLKGDFIDGQTAFKLKEAMGLPIEILEEIANESGMKVDHIGYGKLMKEHKEKSRAAAKDKFVGGLGDHSPESKAYHTVAHLLLATLRNKLGEEVVQKGQNITYERLRYDFSYPETLGAEKITEIETEIQNLINKDLVVDMIEIPYKKSLEMNVQGMFHDKYKEAETVKLYRIYFAGTNPDESKNLVSIEYCGGPHVENTKEIKKFGKFKIVKEESSGSGVRRIRGVFQ